MMLCRFFRLMKLLVWWCNLLEIIGGLEWIVEIMEMCMFWCCRYLINGWKLLLFENNIIWFICGVSFIVLIVSLIFMFFFIFW